MSMVVIAPRFEASVGATECTKQSQQEFLIGNTEVRTSWMPICLRSAGVTCLCRN